jgi:uncharacterized protein with PQ loop repeat
MNIIDLVGLVACIITTIYTAFGLPVQVLKNHREKSTAGLSLPMMSMAFCTFTSWVVYGFVKPIPDWYVIISNGPGVVCTALILVQFYLYGLQKPSSPGVPRL